MSSVIIPEDFAKPVMKVETAFFNDLFLHGSPQQKHAICGCL